MIVLYVGLGVIGVVISGLVITYAVCACINPNKKRPGKIDGATGLIQARGTNIYDGDGNLIQLRGINLGNWFDQEFWMAVSAVGEFETGVYTQRRGYDAMKANKNLTDDDIRELDDIYLDNYIKERDIQIIAELGFNVVRVNFTYMNLTTDGKTLRKGAFDKLDKLIFDCKKNGLYVILDLHGAIGSQNMDIHSGDDSRFDLYGNPEHRRLTIELWREIARHYAGNKTVAAYDLLNEPRRRPHRFAGKAQFDFYDELYKAVREIDKDRMIIVECFTFPIHGVNGKKYGWTNVCYSYHIYNNTFLPQRSALRFYKALHNLMRYKTPVYIGEWSCKRVAGDWIKTMEYFDKLGWSYTSWTYKTDRYNYYGKIKPDRPWGMFELDIPPVDLSTAAKDEIAAAYNKVGTENATPSIVYDVYKNYNKE